MKKLPKLNINPEKVMKNEELVSLKGGYGSGDRTACSCVSNGSDLGCVIVSGRVTSAYSECEQAFGGPITWSVGAAGIGCTGCGCVEF